MSDVATDDGFVELAPPSKFSGRPAEIIISTTQRRNGPVRLQLNLSPSAAAALGSGARVRTAWNEKTRTLRLRAVDDGPFEWHRSTRGDRFLLKVTLPAGLRNEPGIKEPCPHRWDGETLFCIVPPAFVPAPPKPDPAAAAKAAVEMARQAVPAPSFSTRR